MNTFHAEIADTFISLLRPWMIDEELIDLFEGRIRDPGLDIHNSMLEAMCAHGIADFEEQMRTWHPVWICAESVILGADPAWRRRGYYAPEGQES